MINNIDHWQKEEALYEVLSFIKNDLGLSNRDVACVLKVHKSTVGRWFVSGRIPLSKNDGFLRKRLRLVGLIVIHMSLSVMFSDKEKRLAWLKTEHPVIGQLPWELMKAEDGLCHIRNYLENHLQRGG